MSTESRLGDAGARPGPPALLGAARARSPALLDARRLPSSPSGSRLRLVARDPKCLFAHWDVEPAWLDGLRGRLGDRVVAVSPLTLRIEEADRAPRAVFMPQAQRSAYLAASPDRRYRVELGLTLPWGEFHRLAVSAEAVTPRLGPSSQGARRLRRYPDWSETRRSTGAVDRPSAQASTNAPGMAAPSQVRRGGASDAFHPGGRRGR